MLKKISYTLFFISFAAVSLLCSNSPEYWNYNIKKQISGELVEIAPPSFLPSFRSRKNEQAIQGFIDHIEKNVDSQDFLDTTHRLYHSLFVRFVSSSQGVSTAAKLSALDFAEKIYQHSNPTLKIALTKFLVSLLFINEGYEMQRDKRARIQNELVRLRSICLAEESGMKVSELDEFITFIQIHGVRSNFEKRMVKGALWAGGIALIALSLYGGAYHIKIDQNGKKVCLLKAVQNKLCTNWKDFKTTAKVCMKKGPIGVVQDKINKQVVAPVQKAADEVRAGAEQIQGVVNNQARPLLHVARQRVEELKEGGETGARGIREVAIDMVKDICALRLVGAPLIVHVDDEEALAQIDEKAQGYTVTREEYQEWCRTKIGPERLYGGRTPPSYFKHLTLDEYQNGGLKKVWRGARQIWNTVRASTSQDVWRESMQLRREAVAAES
jgi:hypothetical protein